MIDFQTQPDQYKHWTLAFDGPVATLIMDVAEDGGLVPGYDLKLNSYDLGVDIELYDAVQRLRLEHPEVKTVVLTSGKENVFCAGANIRMLGQSSHGHKVNFCKFTNETRNSIEDASENSGQTYIAAVNGSCAGGGYELALATDHILLIDDGSTTVSLPEVPLLAVLPGTGGLTRLTDKRKVRRDRADVFCTTEEGIRGKRAIDWNLVDEVAPRSRFDEAISARAQDLAEQSDRPDNQIGVPLPPLNRTIDGARVSYPHVAVEIDRDRGIAEITVNGPASPPPQSIDEICAQGADFWPLALARELDDMILHLRANEDDIGVWVFRTSGDSNLVAEADAALGAHAGHWLVREITLYLKRTFKRLDVTSRSMVALVEPGSCFTGTLFELTLAADRSYMLDGQMEDDNRPPPSVQLTDMNFGPYTMANGLTRLSTRFLGDPDALEEARAHIGTDIEGLDAEERGLVTFAPDDIDWDDEVRIALEERASFSPDAMTGMEANLRFPGPETMETRIFARLTAWQNWIFQRPNAVGDEGALQLYGTGDRAKFNKHRV